MAVTKFGEFMRILRIKRKIIMKDTAESLQVTTPFLSAVENGKKKIPDTWFERIKEIYSLNNEESIELKRAIEESTEQIKIDISNFDSYQKDLILEFQRSFSNVDEETSKRIIKLSKGED